MKKFILFTALAMLTGTIVLNPLNSQAQSTTGQNAPAPDSKRIEFLQTYHATCSKKDTESAEKCCQLSKELIDKYPNADKQFIDFAKRTTGRCEVNSAYQKFYKALEAFYASAPVATKLDALLTSGDAYLELDKDPQSPFHLFIVAHKAIAGQRATAQGVLKNLEQVKTYAERAIKAFETLNPPDKFKTIYTDLNLFNLRDEVLANMNHYLGSYLIETRGDQPEAQDQALAYLNKSIQVRSKDSKELIGWKSPYNYNLRSFIYQKRYTELRKKYDPLSEVERAGDTGKELIKQINQILDTKLIPELARIIATATNPGEKDMLTDATDEFNNFWKFRVDDPSKAPAYLKSFEADPTIEGPPVPAKPDDSTGAEAPNVKGGTTKPSAGTATGTGRGKANSGTRRPTRPRRKP